MKYISILLDMIPVYLMVVAETTLAHNTRRGKITIDHVYVTEVVEKCVGLTVLALVCIYVVRWILVGAC